MSSTLSPKYEPDGVKRKAYRKIWWHIIPLLFVCYGVAFIDRINIGFTKLQMSETLHIDATWYGIAAGAFFITYALCEIPSNLFLAKWGARKTFVRIMRRLLFQASAISSRCGCWSVRLKLDSCLALSCISLTGFRRPCVPA
jgi:sugar phosphate permease